MIAAIVLCAGFGTRLRPVTLEIPKPAVPFLGRPMVWYAVRALHCAGIRRIAANLCHLPDAMEACFRSVCEEFGMDAPVFFREGDDIAGTGGGAAACARLMPSADRFVVYHGDVLSACDISAALASHAESGCSASLVVAPRPKETALGLVETADGEIVRIRDWRAVAYDAHDRREARCFAGIHILERRVLECIEPHRHACLVTEIYPKMLACGEKIHAVPEDSFFADIGTPQSYLDAQKAILQTPDLLPGARCPDASSNNFASDGVVLIPPVFVDGSCRCRNAEIGPNAVLSHGAAVENARVSDCACFGKWTITR